MAPHFDINLITVGGDVFEPDEIQKLDNALGRSKQIFEVHGLPIGTVNRFTIPIADARLLFIPANIAEERAITHRWAVRNDALDVFVVVKINEPGVAGRSPAPGGCDKRRTKNQRTPLVSLQTSDLFSGIVLTHEICHYLGLQHCELEPPGFCGPQNVMAVAKDVGSSKLTVAQVERMKQHCMVRP